MKFLKNEDSDIANRERSDNRRRSGNGGEMHLMADSVIRGLDFNNSILKQERGKVEQKSPLEGMGILRNRQRSFTS
jgi:hypothetical protein